jgi:CBS domain containing-hemolysin-like protein
LPSFGFLILILILLLIIFLILILLLIVILFVASETGTDSLHFTGHTHARTRSAWVAPSVTG